MNGTTLKVAAVRAAIFVIAGILCCTQALATTVTYNFDETGWVNTFGTTENFFGSFTGTADAQGNLTLSDLSSFSAEMMETNSVGYTKAISNFGSGNGITGLGAFTYTAGSNSLSLFATGTPGATICLGGAVVAGDCGALPKQKPGSSGSPPPAPYGLFFSSVNGQLNANTFSTPTVSLAQIPAPTPVPPSTAAPEPAYLAEFGTVLLFAAWLIGQRRSTSANRAG